MNTLYLGVIKKSVLTFTIFILLFFFVLAFPDQTRAIEAPSSCPSGSVFYFYDSDAYMCCPSTYSFPSGYPTIDGNCTPASEITLSFLHGLAGQTCVYKAALSQLVRADNPNFECYGSEGYFTLTGNDPDGCKSNQCEWQSYCYSSREEGCNSVFWGFGSYRCTIGFRNGFICCPGAEWDRCRTTPWCETSCPAGTPPPNGGNGGSGGGSGLDPIELSPAEKCEGDPDFDSCTSCYGSDGVWTELGCIKATQYGVTVAVMRIFVGIVTGIAVVRFIQAGFMLNTDDPEQIKEGKSIAVSAIMALVFGGMIPLVLHFLGVDVLGLGEELGSFF